KLNGTAETALPLAAPVVTLDAPAAVSQMLRARHGDEAWLDISKSIQDRLRERKRDSLVAWLLTRPMPADAPTGKWENANDLFAYYLIDVEMCSCQLTSRIVQASAAVQLFVQRCFMGLEPEVRVGVEEDDAWNQWSWMRQYRVWEANRRVFAWPENYAEPELRRDKSEIFKNLENELLQNEVNRDTVETAFLRYVEGLDDVAQLEVAGTWYQETTRTLHVFGRTPGAEPRLYYYRQFIDGRRWTAWSKVDVDIKSDLLVPLISNERLHLVWPEFREEPVQPSHVSTPEANKSSVPVGKPQKKMNVFLAISEHRNGKWTPKKVSEQPVESPTFTGDDFDRGRYVILPLDFTWIPGASFLLLVYDTVDHSQKLFELAGCRGYPEPLQEPLRFFPWLTRFDRDALKSLKNVEVTQGLPLVPQSSLVLREKILDLTPDRFKITYPHYLSYFDRLWFTLLALALAGNRGANNVFRDRGMPVTLGTFYDWFYADKLRTFFVRPEFVAEKDGRRLFYPDLVAFTQEILDLIAAGHWPELWEKLRDFGAAGYRFQLLFAPFYHPLTCLFAKRLYADGVEGLMDRATQLADKGLLFQPTYAPTSVVDPKYPRETVDFTPDGAYSLYNWELFFHAPLLIATRLSKNQRFEEAMRWFHFIFDPTGGHDRDPVTNAVVAAPRKFWITQPFYQRQASDYLQQRIENLMRLLADDPSSPTDPALLQELERQVMDWRRNPFDPHLVAQFRTVAYQKMTVLKYIENLIAWGDQRFRLDTLETVNEATQLYVLAAEILGPRPRRVPPAAKPRALTFNELENDLDAFSNAVVEFENLIPPLPPGGGTGSGGPAATGPLPSLLYFCIPQNDQMLRLWDTVADRLYKIRHCLNIEGVARQLALFAPPIDPAALVRAVAAGLDIASALNELDAPLPHYRFATMLQKANELANDLKALGGALLSALEKKDAEALARLRQEQEIAVLAAVREVKKKQTDEAQVAIEGLEKTREMVQIRRDHYDSREFMNAGEVVAMALSGTSVALHTAATIADVLAGTMFLIPDFKVGASGFGGSPHVTVEPPTGQKIGQSVTRGANGMYNLATIVEKGASIASTVAGYQRRQEDWDFQKELAEKELEQLDRQLAAARLRQEIAQKELDNHDLQTENARAVDEFMRGKYTNQELYQW
ncbi:MAG TPA: neuraminidase-like domain-containing protein, partial [Thermoanaerobaculia bacterium]|nr:neuraminidase-like domain-containing protein [Thermoanaerobaculia bacterium]